MLNLVNDYFAHKQYVYEQLQKGNTYNKLHNQLKHKRHHRLGKRDQHGDVNYNHKTVLQANESDYQREADVNYNHKTVLQANKSDDQREAGEPGSRTETEEKNGEETVPSCMETTRNHQMEQQQLRHPEQVQQHDQAANTATSNAEHPFNLVEHCTPTKKTAAYSRTASSSAALPEGKHRVSGLLRAVCAADGSLHVRPLCTAGDVVLALHELLDPQIFLHGSVQLPHAVGGTHERHIGGVYRFTYTLNAPDEWSYLRYRTLS